MNVLKKPVRYTCLWIFVHFHCVVKITILQTLLMLIARPGYSCKHKLLPTVRYNQMCCVLGEELLVRCPRFNFRQTSTFATEKQPMLLSLFNFYNIREGKSDPAVRGGGESKGLVTNKKTFFEAWKKIRKKMWALSSRGGG